MECYGASGNKEKVETMSAEDIQALVVGSTSSTNLQDDGTLNVYLTKHAPNLFYPNGITPTKINFTIASDSISHSRHCVMVSKRIGTSGKVSDFIGMNDKDSSLYTVKFLNDPDITNWTRLYIEVYKDSRSICVRVDGC